MANKRATRPTTEETQQSNDSTPRDNAEAVVQQPIDAAVDGDIIDAPFGAKVGTGTSRPVGTPPQPRAQTFVSAVNGGKHLNLCLSAAMMAVAGQWEHGAQIRWQCKNGKPDVVRLRTAVQKAYSIRTHGQQRPHFTVPTASVGGGLSNLEAIQAESWIDGDEICIRVRKGIFSGIFSVRGNHEPIRERTSPQIGERRQRPGDGGLVHSVHGQDAADYD